MKWYQKIATKMLQNSLKSEGYSTMNLDAFSGRTFWGINNSTIETNEAIYSAISRLSNSMASLPLKLKKNHDSVNNDLSDNVLNNPCGSHSFFEIMKNMETIRNEKGNAYALIERDVRSQFLQFHLLNSDLVEPAIERDTKEVWYLVIGDDGVRHAIHNMEMFHVKGTVKNGGTKGISPIDVLKNTTTFDKAVQEFSLREMSKPESFVLKYDANVDKEKRKQIVNDFRVFYQNNGGILFQEPGVHIDPIEKKYLSAETVAAEELTKSRVANVFNMPLAFLNGEKGLKFTKLEDLNRFYMQHTLLPTIRQYEMELNRKTLNRANRAQGMEWKFNVRGLLRGDTVAQMQFYQSGIRSGYLKVNEVRGWEDLPPDENGDTLLISGDLYPLGMSPEERNPKPPAPPPPDDPNPENPEEDEEETEEEDE